MIRSITETSFAVVFSNRVESQAADPQHFHSSMRRLAGKQNLSALASDAACQLNVLGHDGHALRVDGTKVGILEESNKVRLTGLLKSEDCRGLKTEVSLEVLGDLANETLERSLADKQIR